MTCVGRVNIEVGITVVTEWVQFKSVLSVLTSEMRQPGNAGSGAPLVTES